MLIRHPDHPDLPSALVDDQSFRTVWEPRGWVEHHPEPDLLLTPPSTIPESIPDSTSEPKPISRQPRSR